MASFGDSLHSNHLTESRHFQIIHALPIYRL